MHIVGTAGHVDHGKSALVEALTGSHPDRWIEERLRGMTLDLGFARFQEGDVEAGIVDVPGHERFIHNMLAGVAGMELLLLVVAADEGVMPQTREHLDILRFLNVRSTLVVVTKSDLLDDDALRASLAAIQSDLSETFARKAPTLAVSSRSGAGIPALRARMAEELRALPMRDDRAPAYLPIDRVFSLTGIGTVVTGTLMQGAIAVGETLRLQPGDRTARVRSLQVFGSPCERASGGSRVALSLAGIERTDVERGAAIAGPEFSAATRFAVHFTPLPSALDRLRRRTPVRVAIGSSEVLGMLVFANRLETAVGSDAELHLRAPALAFPGVRFVARALSPKTVLGGGEVRALGGGAFVEEGVAGLEAVRALVSARFGTSQGLARVASDANLREDVARAALCELVELGEVLELARPQEFVDSASAEALLTRVLEHLTAMHRNEPWALGATSIALARVLALDESYLVRVLAAFAARGRIRARGGYYAAAEHRPVLAAEQQRFFEGVVGVDPEYPFRPTPEERFREALRGARIAGIARAYETLLARGALVKVGEDLYRGSQIDGIRQRIESFLAEHDGMTPADLRDLIGSSRKYVVPLLEWFDVRGVTIRSGDRRYLRASSRGREKANE